jgi:hypothetical protein
MIDAYTDPILLDFIKCCIDMPDDERKHMEAMTGYPFDIDSAAIGNFTVQGPKWVLKDGEITLAVGGFAFQRKGVWSDFLLTTPEAWAKENWFSMTRVCRKIMDKMFDDGIAHRIECVVPVARMDKRPELERWYKTIGYSLEGFRHKYCADGGDAVAFARVN